MKRVKYRDDHNNDRRPLPWNRGLVLVREGYGDKSKALNEYENSLEGHHLPGLVDMAFKSNAIVRLDCILSWKHRREIGSFFQKIK